MNKKTLKILINVLYIISWLTIAGTIIAAYLLKDTINVYNMGTYMYALGIIDLICFIIIFTKSHTNKYFK
jgi:hypothetical protein